MAAAVGYYRFSSSNQNEESIMAQRRIVNIYADKHNVTILKEYIDEARSATTDDRPQFQAMINDILHGRVKVDLVLVHKLDRFARNRIDAAIYKQKLQSKGVKLLAVDQPLGDSPEDSLLEGILESINEFYSKNLSREVKLKQKEYAYQAKHLGGTPPLGYNLDPATKKYIINEKESEAVKVIYEMAAAGEGYAAIINKLNNDGFKTKLGKSFGKNSIHEILNNEKYTGTYVFNRAEAKEIGKPNNRAIRNTHENIIRVPDAMPVIIEKKEWEKVRKIMEQRRQISPRRHGDTIYLLTGKLFCGLCGAAYTGIATVAGRNKERYKLYRCVSKKQKRDCTNKDIRKEVIETAVLDELENAFNPDNVDKLITMAQERYQKQLESNKEEIKQITVNLAKTKQRMDNLFEAIESGSLASDVAGPRLNALSKEKDMLEARLIELDADKPALLSRNQILEYLIINKEILADRENLSAIKHIIDTYVEKVILYADDIKFRFRLPSDASCNGGGGGS
jgi:site-specific DNA recombinase